jgi:hypothetical protein
LAAAVVISYFTTTDSTEGRGQKKIQRSLYLFRPSSSHDRDLAVEVLGTSRDGTSDLIHQHQLSIRRILNGVTDDARDELIDEFPDQLFDLASEDRRHHLHEFQIS